MVTRNNQTTADKTHIAKSVGNSTDNRPSSILVAAVMRRLLTAARLWLAGGAVSTHKILPLHCPEM